MKKLVVFLAIVLCFGVAYAEVGWESEVEEEAVPVNNTGIPQAVIDSCPTKGMMVNNMDCFDCHTKPSFKIKEAPPFEIYDLPYGAEFKYQDGQLIGHITLSGIQHDSIWTALDYFDRRPLIKTVVINVDSYGGAIFEMWGIVSLIDEYKDRFNIITECRTTAFSAGLIVFMAADTRLVSPYAHFMWHEVASWTMFDKKFPSKAEHEAEMMRAFQDLANNFIADRCDMSKEDLDKIISFKDWWLSGKEILKLKMATGSL